MRPRLAMPLLAILHSAVLHAATPSAETPMKADGAPAALAASERTVTEAFVRAVANGQGCDLLNSSDSRPGPFWTSLASGAEHGADFAYVCEPRQRVPTDPAAGPQQETPPRGIGHQIGGGGIRVLVHASSQSPWAKCASFVAEWPHSRPPHRISVVHPDSEDFKYFRNDECAPDQPFLDLSKRWDAKYGWLTEGPAYCCSMGRWKRTFLH